MDHAASWKLIRPHFQAIFQDLVFPMMCYSNEDDQLWHSDPYEYIRLKFGKSLSLYLSWLTLVIAYVIFRTEISD